MLENVKINRTLFLDLETASSTPKFEDLSPLMQEHFKLKFHRLYEAKNQTPADYFATEAGLHSEFSRIVCAVVGRITQKSQEEPLLELVTISDQDERKLLQQVLSYFEKLPDDAHFCSYNGTEFDWPTLGRRALINGLPVPKCLDFYSIKPWERRGIDPMEIFRFGDKRKYTKMELLATVLGLDSSKEGMDGSEVSKVFWAGDRKLIEVYCRKDVICLVNIFLKLKGMDPIPEGRVVVKN